jgi:hypothetical protein
MRFAGSPTFNTPDSTRELAERFVANRTPWLEGTIGHCLLESSCGDIAISELEGGLRSAWSVPQSIYEFLAVLRVAREFADRPLPDAHKAEERRQAISVRGERLHTIRAELYSIRPPADGPLL